MSFDMFVSTDSMRRASAASQRGGSSSGARFFPMEEGIPLHVFQQQHRSGLGVRPNSEYSELAPLTDPRGRQKRNAYEGAPPWTSRMSTTTSVALCGAVTLWTLIFALLGVLYWNLSTSMNTMRSEFRPYVSETLDHLISILRNADHGTGNANQMANNLKLVSEQALPAIGYSLNATTAIIDRLEKLAKNPVLKLSLNQE